MVFSLEYLKSATKPVFIGNSLKMQDFMRYLKTTDHLVLLTAVAVSVHQRVHVPQAASCTTPPKFCTQSNIEKEIKHLVYSTFIAKI